MWAHSPEKHLRLHPEPCEQQGREGILPLYTAKIHLELCIELWGPSTGRVQNCCSEHRGETQRWSECWTTSSVKTGWERSLISLLSQKLPDFSKGKMWSNCSCTRNNKCIIRSRMVWLQIKIQDSKATIFRKKNLVKFKYLLKKSRLIEQHRLISHWLNMACWPLTSWMPGAYQSCCYHTPSQQDREENI